MKDGRSIATHAVHKKARPLLCCSNSPIAMGMIAGSPDDLFAPMTYFGFGRARAARKGQVWPPLMVTKPQLCDVRVAIDTWCSKRSVMVHWPRPQVHKSL